MTVRFALLAALLALVAFPTGCDSGEDAAAKSEAKDEQPRDAQVDQNDAADDNADTNDSSENAQDQEPLSHGPNRLADETSPYLLMHAHNPVDWYPWGDEAFAKAKEENKVIFLSIGYSSCHWCHVMEKESFMDEEIARFLNEHFVCIKVDREERPDVDEIYMTALQIYNQLTQGRSGGGWPLSMFLTPEGKPLAGGTYYPPRAGHRPGMSFGFIDVINSIQSGWMQAEPDARETADQLTLYVKRQLEREDDAANFPLDPQALALLFDSMMFDFDPDHGGFGFHPQNPRMPKFPSPSNLVFLLDIVLQTGADDDDQAKQRTELAKQMLLETLDHMASGGIYDHLGGGFHRYSVDRFWDVPHFEKMLYDNGQLVSLYAEAYELTGEERYRRVVDETLAFIQREMMDASGGFYSALDADSEGEEGIFYIWTKQEVSAALDGLDVELFMQVYGLDGEPNFEGTHYVLRLSKSMEETAEERGVSVDELLAQLAPMKTKLLELRAQRERPLTDTKILTGWNGLMIRGFADAGRLLDNPDYLNTAKQAAEFALANLKTDDGRLLRTHSAGEAKLNAYLDDYAYLVDGLVALHKATGDDRWLQESLALTDTQIALFADDRGGFYRTSDDHESLLVRAKGPADNVRPSASSVATDNLLYLGDVAGNGDYLKLCVRTLRSNGRVFAQAPGAYPRMAVVLRELANRGIVEAPLVAPPVSSDAASGDFPLVAPPASSDAGQGGR